jgi:uncharacterized membrane protein YozB (DUF420 family)
MTLSATLNNANKKTPVGQYDRLFYTGMSTATVVTVFVGFAPSYYLKDYFGAPPLAPLVHVHGLVFTSWIVLFFAQTVLIARHRVSVHRRLGLAGTGLAALLVVVGLATAVGSVRRNVATGGTGALAFLATPFGDMLVFAILATAGILYRRRPETHKRLMLVATIALLSAPISRWPLAIIQRGPVTLFLLTDLFVLAGVCYDLASRRRVHPAYVWGGLLLVISQPVRLAISHTDAWLAFANKLVR